MKRSTIYSQWSLFKVYGGVAVLLAETLILLVLALKRWRVVNKTR
jgi:hypothetical protein